MPLSLADIRIHFSSRFRDAVKGNMAKVKGEALGVASGYPPGQIKICIFPQATPKAFYCTIFAFREICKFSFPLRAVPQVFRKLALCYVLLHFHI
ncbi:hypothetical protein T12_7773 [Trichinella patagoniensis]|uniref:Uncharacterized protein n=1 Tax=Trichinella patagoniensis TaxID=990121 RepID=A0A0V1AEX1_9BILA|nr:hypothetical protein T12_7773 [Trichinella patagoniensis]